jgi:hypothetical protein
MPGRDQGAVQHQDPSAQPGTSLGEEKKSAAPELTATGTVDAYENLRAAALNAAPISDAGLGAIRHHGMVRWLHGLTCQRDNVQRQSPPPRPIASRSPTTCELTRLLAGIVVTLTREPVHV